MADDIPDTFIEALTENQLALKSFVRASLGNQADLDDVTQKTNLVLWKKASDWDPATPFLRWAFTVARYEILAYYRDKGREKLVFDEDVVSMMVDESTTVVQETPERLVALRLCLAQLKPEHKQILNARYSSRTPVSQIAALVNKTEDSVKSLMLRLRKKLNQCVTNQLKSAKS